MAWSSDWWTNGWNGPVDPEQDEFIKRLGALGRWNAWFPVFFLADW